MIFWRSKRQNQILEKKSIMDEQTKKPISGTIIVAIEKSSRLPLLPPTPFPIFGKKKKKKYAEEWGLGMVVEKGSSPACVKERVRGRVC